MNERYDGFEDQGSGAPEAMERKRRIQALNDSLRTAFLGGRVMATAGIAALPPAVLEAVLRAVQAFDAFAPENDPWDEHDFGAVEAMGTQAFFKIDAYDLRGENASPDPADPAVTLRVMTVMRPDEY